MNEIVFSHRPRAGISVAATSENGKLFIALAMTNDGTSRNHIFHKKRRDEFSRIKARSILRGRLESLIRGEENEMGLVFETGLSAREFMYSFRKVFKAMPDESDGLFIGTELFGGVETLFRESAKNIKNRTIRIINETVAAFGYVGNQ